MVRSARHGIPALVFSMALVGCGAGELTGSGGAGTRRATAGDSCSALDRISTTELTAIKNTAYFEASYLPAHRASECAKVTGTIIGRQNSGEFGTTYLDVITAPYQFEVYDAIRICAGGSCHRITDGVGVDQADSVSRYGRWDSASAHQAGYLECAAAVEQTLRSTPATIYLFFAADGSGRNAFRTPTGYPSGCNILDGEAVQPEPQSGACAADENGRTGCLHGTIREAGELRAGVQVSAWGHDGDFRTAATDAGGVYAFTGLHPGILYNLAVNTRYEDGGFIRVSGDHPCEVRDNVELDSGPDGWHGEWFDLEYEDDPDHCRGTE